jgi:hypothetical protein
LGDVFKNSFGHPAGDGGIGFQNLRGVDFYHLRFGSNKLKREHCRSRTKDHITSTKEKTNFPYFTFLQILGFNLTK